jgi:Domain of unknown function (DUF6265)
MRYLLRLAAMFLTLSPATLLASDPLPMPGWMTGAWAGGEGEAWVDEFWTPPRGNMMIGASRTGQGSKLLLFEHMRIEREADGTLVFWALPGGKNPTRFVAVHADGDDVIFENAANDYPQRVGYWREGKVLRAQISLIDGSKPMNFNFELMGATQP